MEHYIGVAIDENIYDDLVVLTEPDIDRKLNVGLVVSSSIAQRRIDSGSVSLDTIEAVNDTLVGEHEGEMTKQFMLSLHYHPFSRGGGNFGSQEFASLPLVEQVRRTVKETYSWWNSPIDEIITDSPIDPPYDIAIQLNMDWADHDALELLKEEFPNLKIIQQVSDLDDHMLASKALSRNRELDYVLLDASKGKGFPLDLDQIARAYEKVASSGVAVGIAGGLTPSNVHGRVSELVRVLGTNEFSIDAQSGLRKNGSFNVWTAQRYIVEANRAFNGEGPSPDGRYETEEDLPL